MNARTALLVCGVALLCAAAVAAQLLGGRAVLTLLPHDSTGIIVAVKPELLPCSKTGYALRLPGGPDELVAYAVYEVDSRLLRIHPAEDTCVYTDGFEP